jgi:hypothetical protein
MPEQFPLNDQTNRNPPTSDEDRAQLNGSDSYRIAQDMAQNPDHAINL